MTKCLTKMQVGQGREPFAHQLATYDFAKDREYAALFLEMGLGKTAIVINLCEHHFQAGHIAKALIVCPLSLCDTWQEEVVRCFPNRKVLNLCDRAGTAGKLRLMEEADAADYILINYDALGDPKRHLSNFGAELHKYLLGLDKKLLICCDESTYIKNALAGRSKGVLALGVLAGYRIVMTGTPLPQGPQDAFGQYAFLKEDLFGRYYTNFRNNWFVMHPVWKTKVLGFRPGKEELFKEILYSCAIRFTKDQCTDLPPKLYETRTYKLSPEQQAFYNEFARQWVAEVEEHKISATNGVVKSMRLAQSCTGFVGDSDEEGCHVNRVFKDNAKLDLLMEVLDEVEGKVIIWCAWRKNVADVCQRLRLAGIKHVDYTGETPDRREHEMAFREDPSVRCFVGTGSAGGMGLNLQGPQVRTVVYFSQDYKVLTRQQSEDRAHRGGIKHNVTIIDLVAKGTAEEAIVKALRKGVRLQDRILEAPAAFVRGLE